jgi:hypothetical protein
MKGPMKVPAAVSQSEIEEPSRDNQSALKIIGKSKKDVSRLGRQRINGQTRSRVWSPPVIRLRTVRND